MHPPIHVILEYNPSPKFNREAPETVPNHLRVIDNQGSVLWPKISKSGRTRLSKEDVPRINDQIAMGAFENHFYMYGPEHTKFDRRLDVGLLKHIFLEHEVPRDDPRIPLMYRLHESEERVMYFFELTQITGVDLGELENLLIYPDMTFLDLVSFVSPQRVLEAKARHFFL